MSGSEDQKTAEPKDCAPGKAKAQAGQRESTMDANLSTGVRTAPARGPAIPREHEVRFISDVGGGLRCIILKGLTPLHATAAGPGRKRHIPVPAQGPSPLEEWELFPPATDFPDFQQSSAF